jgi:para-aminobenzoate synthetase/4-amino-4-deoxychorismate lyase
MSGPVEETPEMASEQACFTSTAGDRPGWNMSFRAPEAVRRATCLSEVAEVLAFAQAASDAGRWVVVALAYEAAPAFDPALAAHAPADFPLAYAAVYAAPCDAPPVTPPDGRGSYALSPWRPLTSRDRYRADLERIRACLRSGQSYQVNYTMPFRAVFAGDARAWFDDLRPRQAAGYAAYLDMGDHRVLCFSPELFFQHRDREVLARPMKGTMPRGAGPEEDAALAARLASCPKNRAENAIIVDLLRNDLGRVAETGSVAVRRLFTVEAYPTLWQMTSEISARLRPGVNLFAMFQALFPCGSVTGAPKNRTMGIIHELEGRPRGIYCGALGFVRPGGDCAFCVPIRTVRLHAATGRAEYWTGGGVTIDSDTEQEYAECLVKMRFLRGAPGTFRLLETLLLDGGRYALLPGHLARMGASADALGFVFDPEAAWRTLDCLPQGRTRGRFRVRLLLDAAGRFEALAAPCGDMPAIRRVGLARTPVSSGHALLRHKTDWRVPYDTARRERPDCDDVLLYNERGRITETTIANVAVRRGRRLVTPPLSDGLLPGVYRAELLRRGEVVEDGIDIDEARAAGELFLFNALRGMWRARLTEAATEPPHRG